MQDVRQIIRQTLVESFLGEGVIPTVTLQQARDQKLFGPVFHGSSQENHEKISREGFKIFYGNRGDDGITNGYPSDQPYALGFFPPIHHLGYGIYFTTVKAIGKKFNRNSVKGLKEFYLNAPNILKINFASPKKMMQWWLDNGYDGELANQGGQARVEATKKLTDNLRSKYDAVWFKGKGLNTLLDGDQIVVFDTSRIFVVDNSGVGGKEIGAKVRRTENKYRMMTHVDVETGTQKRITTDQVEVPKGVVGIVMDKQPVGPMVQHWRSIGNTSKHWAEDSEFVYTVKWSKGGKEFNVLDRMIEPT